MVPAELVALATIALVPGAVALFTAADLSVRRWIAAAAGGGGWLLAYALRIPVIIAASTALAPQQRMWLLVLLSGVFEEGVRYAVMRILSRGDSYRVRDAVSLGLGWGVTEALLIYVAALPIAAMRGLGYHQLLPGALERNSAIAFHALVSIVVAYAAARRSIPVLVGAMAMHSGLNAAAVLLLAYLRNPWAVEGAIALSLSVPAAAAYACARALARGAGGDGGGGPRVQ